VIVGQARRGRLRSRAAGLGDAVVFTGQVAEDDLPRFRVGDVFAMPCRTRLGA
jgi:hypothetical protein